MMRYGIRNPERPLRIPCIFKATGMMRNTDIGIPMTAKPGKQFLHREHIAAASPIAKKSNATR